MSKLLPNKIRYEYGLKICEKIIPWGAKWNKNVYLNNKLAYKKGTRYKADRLLSNGTGIVKGITIHNTNGNADAETYTRSTYPNQNMLSSRVHYYIDDKEIWQNLREDEVGWHAGDGRGPGNETTISLEIITKGKTIKDEIKAEDNGAKLCAILLDKYNLSIKDVYTHKYWSGKNCPINILPRWNDFLNKVQFHLTNIKKEKEALYLVQVGAFKNEENAKKLLEQLVKAGFNGCIRKS